MYTALTIPYTMMTYVGIGSCPHASTLQELTDEWDQILPVFIRELKAIIFHYDPAFEFINKNRRMNFDACIYLTDGYAPAPTIRPRCNLLYVITPGGQTGGHLKWGRFIKMK